MSIQAAEPAGTLARLRSSADRLAVLEEEHAAEKSRRDALVVTARDEGKSWRTIAREAHISVSRCVAIVAGDLVPPHAYRRSPFSGAGNCECGGSRRWRQHQPLWWRVLHPRKPWRMK